MAATCLFCEAQIDSGAHFCTQCGKKVPVKKSDTAPKKTATKQTDSKQTVDQSNGLFFENVELYCSLQQLQAFDLKLQTYSYSQIQEHIHQAFLKPFNLYLRKSLLKRYGQHIKNDLLGNKQLPESSGFLIRSI